jgi:hypothetical protein
LSHRALPPRWGNLLKLAATGLALLLAALLLPAPASAGVVGNCLLCHRNQGLAALDEDGELRLFFVNEETYASSVHAKVACDGCHPDIDKIPHDEAEPVDCLRSCHIVEPTREKQFSHAPVRESLDVSVHSSVDADGKLKDWAEDYPTCKDCHDNPLYRPLAIFKTVKPGISERAVGRCRVCHESDEFIDFYYSHVTTRLQRSRSPRDIAEVCARCHRNEEFGRRHGEDTQRVVSYEATFHGKAAGYMSEVVPDCLDCHVGSGDSVHHMLPAEDPDSSVHPDNKAGLCSQDVCHPNVSSRAASYDVHAQFRMDRNPVLFWFTIFFYCIAGGTLLPLCGLILLDLLRRNFPNAVFLRRRR